MRREEAALAEERPWPAGGGAKRAGRGEGARGGAKACSAVGRGRLARTCSPDLLPALSPLKLRVPRDLGAYSPAPGWRRS